MFFDLTSMQPEDLERSVDAAQDFLRKKMQPADLVALVSLGDTLNVDQDFTADEDALVSEVGAYNGTEGQGFAQGANSNSNQVEDTTGYTPDESEYNDINTDRELFALTPDWALPLPEPEGAANGPDRRFTFIVDGLPPGAKAKGATLTLTAVSGDHAIEVPAHLD